MTACACMCIADAIGGTRRLGLASAQTDRPPSQRPRAMREDELSLRCRAAALPLARTSQP
jgi:hypothetical protein